jgi:hypothetical protein
MRVYGRGGEVKNFVLRLTFFNVEFNVQWRTFKTPAP